MILIKQSTLLCKLNHNIEKLYRSLVKSFGIRKHFISILNRIQDLNYVSRFLPNTCLRRLSISLLEKKRNKAISILQ